MRARARPLPLPPPPPPAATAPAPAARARTRIPVAAAPAPAFAPPLAALSKCRAGPLLKSAGGGGPRTGSAGSAPAPAPGSMPATAPGSRSSPLASPAASPLAAPASMSTIGDLRSFAASSLDNLKRRLNTLHGDAVRDLDASHSCLSKRVKMQTHGCLQLAEEADWEHKKVADKITEVVKNSYKKFVAEVQASTSRVCKVTVAEMAKSAERAIDGLRSHFNISATPA